MSELIRGAEGTLCIRHQIRAYEVGPLGTAGPALLANLMQETAGHHATRLGLSMERLSQDNLAWVLSRLRISINRFPAGGEEVDVVTWPSEIDKHTATRDFVLYTPEGEEIARATSAWVTFELSQRKMVPLPVYIGSSYPSSYPERVLQFESRVLPKLKSHTHAAHIVSRFSDLDINNHVNNVHFIEWVLESAPLLGLSGHPMDLDIQFRSECKAGMDIESRVAQQEGEDGTKLTHSLVVEGSELARAVSAW